MDKNQYEKILQQIERSDYDLKLKGVSAAVLDKIADYGDDYSNFFSYEDVTQIAKEILQTGEVWHNFNKCTEDHIVKMCEDFDYEMRLNWGDYEVPFSVRDTLEAKRALKNSQNDIHTADMPIRQPEEQEEIKTVKTNVGEMPIEDYREMVAMQWGYDSYAEMYNAGVRIGKGYDIKATGDESNTQKKDDFVK